MTQGQSVTRKKMCTVCVHTLYSELLQITYAILSARGHIIKKPMKTNSNSVVQNQWVSVKKPGLLMFCAVAEPRNSGKSAKSREINRNTQNTAKFGRSLIKYISVQQFWNLSQLLGVFTCRKLANLCQNFVTETCKQRSETTRRRLCCKKLGTSHDVKGFAIGSFLERIVVDKFALKITTKSAVFLPIAYGQVCPENSREIPAKSTDFPRFCPQKSREIWIFFPRIIRSPEKPMILLVINCVK